MKGLLHRIGLVQSALILSVIYVSLLPLAIIVRLGIVPSKKIGWRRWHMHEDTLEHVQRQ
jgi:hypothetical protein